MATFPRQRQFWAAHVWDPAALDVERTLKSELSADYNKKTLIFSPDSQIRDQHQREVMLLLRTTHGKDTVAGRRRAYPWEVPDPPRAHPCDLTAVIDCMKVYRAQKETEGPVYDEHGPVSRLRDYLRVDLNSDEFAAVQRRFGDTISQSLPAEVYARVRAGLEEDKEAATRGSILEVETRGGPRHVAVLSNDLLRRARVPTVVCVVMIELTWHAVGLRIIAHPETLCGLDLAVVNHSQVTRDGESLRLPEDIMTDLVARVMRHVGL